MSKLWGGMKYLLFMILIFSGTLFATEQSLNTSKSEIKEFQFCLNLIDSKKVTLHTLNSKLFKKINLKILKDSTNSIKAITSTGGMGHVSGLEIQVLLTKLNDNKTNLRLILKGRNGRKPGPYFSLNSITFKRRFLEIYERWPNKLDCKIQ
jgi:hypothetical protein